MMADTWHAQSSGVTYAANKAMIDLFNANTSVTTVRIYRMWLFNNQTAGITGVFNNVRIHRLTVAPTGGTAITPVPHNTANAALDAGTSVGTGRTVTLGSRFRQLLHSPDEPTLSSLDWDSMLTLVPYAEIWNSGYGDGNVEPLTCRAGQDEGIAVVSVNQTVGVADVELEFTSS
jgi:hypothetical protein